MGLFFSMNPIVFFLGTPTVPRTWKSWCFISATEMSLVHWGENHQTRHETRPKIGIYWVYNGRFSYNLPSWVALGSFHGYNKKITSQLWTYLLIQWKCIPKFILCGIIHGYGYEELESGGTLSKRTKPPWRSFPDFPKFSSSNTPFLTDFPSTFDEKHWKTRDYQLFGPCPVCIWTHMFGLLDWVKIQLYPKHPSTISGLLVKQFSWFTAHSLG